MAGELQLVLDSNAQTGLTVTATVYTTPGGLVVAAGIPCAEPSPGYYVGDMPTAVQGIYLVRFFVGALEVASGDLAWDGAQEVDLLTLPGKIDEQLTTTHGTGSWREGGGIGAASGGGITLEISDAPIELNVETTVIELDTEDCC